MFSPMFSLRGFRSLPPLIALLVLGLSNRAFAQLYDMQERGWSMLNDGYAIVLNLNTTKSERTKNNIETATTKIQYALETMSPYIDKIGDKVADEDKTYASGIKNEVRNTWKGVESANDKLRRLYNENKDSPEKLAAITDEFNNLKAAIQQFETTCKAAYNNSKSRWEEIQASMQKTEGEFKTADEKSDAVNAKDDELFKEELALKADRDRALEEVKKLDTMADQIEEAWLTAAKNRNAAIKDRNADLVKRYSEDLEKVRQMQEKLIDARVDALQKFGTALQAFERKERERKQNWRDMQAALEQSRKIDPFKLFQRFRLWDQEFPAKNYTFKTLK